MIWAISSIILAFFIWKIRKKDQKELTVQDVIGGDKTSVTWDGMTQRGNLFRLVIEVEPINTDHASIEEQRAMWSNFLGLINTLSLPYKLVLQSQLFEMQDYMRDYAASVEQLSDDYPLLKASGRNVGLYLSESQEEDAIRDYRGYFILEYDPVQAASINGVNLGIGKLDDVVGQLGNRKNRLSDEEKSDLALQILEEAAEEIYGFCEQIDMRYQRLDRAGVWNYSYQMLHRELSAHARMVDAIAADSFKRIKRSLTDIGEEGA